MTDNNIERPFKVAEPGERCETCACFFNPAKADVGLCRRYPPQVMIVGMQQTMGTEPVPITRSFHPPMMPNGWCGEYVPRPSSTGATRDGSSIPTTTRPGSLPGSTPPPLSKARLSLGPGVVPLSSASPVPLILASRASSPSSLLGLRSPSRTRAVAVRMEAAIDCLALSIRAKCLCSGLSCISMISRAWAMVRPSSASNSSAWLAARTPGPSRSRVAAPAEAATSNACRYPASRTATPGSAPP